MRIKASLLYGFALCLAAFYLVVSYLALHPSVSSEYKAFYIDRIVKNSTSSPNPELMSSPPLYGVRK